MLLVFDTDKIKEFVFGTNKLKEIRGASSILDDLNRNRTFKELQRIFDLDDDDKIYANGGSAVFKNIPESRANEGIAVIKELYRKNTITASVTGISYQQIDDGYKAKEVGKLIRKEKEGKHFEDGLGDSSQDFLNLPFMKYCDSCGVLPAVTQEKEDNKNKICLCDVCRLKREENFNIRKKGSYIYKRINKDIKMKLNKDIDVSYAEEFDNIKDRKGFIGIIYADGDGMGEKLEKIETLSELREFSNTVDNAVYHAVEKSIIDYLPMNIVKKGDKPIIGNFDVLMLGGDDIIMAVPGDKAVQIAVNILEEFHKLTKEKYSLSVGVVIAHHNFPFQQLLDYAEKLLKVAKKKRSELKRVDDNSYKSGMISFLNITSDIPTDVNAYFNENMTRKILNKREILNKKYQFHWQAYTVEQMKELIKLINDLKKNKIPMSKVNLLREALLFGSLKASVEFLNFLIHVKNVNKRRIIEFLGNREFGEIAQIPWIELIPMRFFAPRIEKTPKKRYSTPLYDLTRLFRFIQEEK